MILYKFNIIILTTAKHVSVITVTPVHVSVVNVYVLLLPNPTVSTVYDLSGNESVSIDNSIWKSTKSFQQVAQDM